MVTMENAEEYVELMFDLCMHTGIQKQMEAFRGKQSCDRPTTPDGTVVMAMEFSVLTSSSSPVSPLCQRALIVSFKWRR